MVKNGQGVAAFFILHHFTSYREETVVSFDFSCTYSVFVDPRFTTYSTQKFLYEIVLGTHSTDYRHYEGVISNKPH